MTEVILRNNNILYIKVKNTRSKSHFIKKRNSLHQIKGIEYHHDLKEFTLPFSEGNVKMLQFRGFEVSQEIRDMVYKNTVKIESAPDPSSVNVPREDFAHLFPSQYEGLKFMEATNGRTLLCWDVGAGKTLGSLSYLNLHEDEYPVLIITPATLKFQWLEEYGNWVNNPKDIQVFKGRKQQKVKCPVVIINYDILPDHQHLLSSYPFKLVIADEVQYIKTAYAPKKKGQKRASFTKRYSAFKKITKKIPKIIALSGTPITRNVSEYFNILNIIRPDIFNNRYSFQQRYCGPRYNGFAMVYDGLSNEGELTELLKLCVDRREKQSNGLIRTPIYLDVEDKYKIDSKDSVARYEAFEGKKKQVFEFIDNIIGSGEKVAVFGYHKKVIEEIAEHYKDRCIQINGDTPVKDRRKLVRRFNEKDNLQVAVCNNQAAGTGLDGLQRTCSYGIMVQMPWTAAERTQIEGRLERTGQKKMVNFYYLIAKDTVDESDVERIEGYMEMFNTVVNDRETEKDEYLEKKS